MIYDTYKKYIDTFGLTQDQTTGKAGITSGNGIRYTGEMCLALNRHGELNVKHSRAIVEAVNRCRMFNGLYRRSPVTNHQQAPDDLKALMYISFMIDPTIAQDFLLYGRRIKITHAQHSDSKTKWAFRFIKLFRLLKYTYNTERPKCFSLSAWLGRRQELICMAQWAAGEKPNMFRRLWWSVAMILSAHKFPNQDTKILNLFMLKVGQARGGFIIRMVCKYWVRQFKKQWLGGAGGVLRSYFIDKNQPSIKALEMEFGE